MEKPRLDEYVRDSYATMLSELGAEHIGYFLDEEHFGNELDTYSNSRIRIVFIRDLGEEFVQLSPLSHPGDFFSLLYLSEMLAPDEVTSTGFEGFETLPKVVQRMYGLFDSSHYPCYRRAYLTYENCRNLLGIRMPDGTEVINYKPQR